MNAGEVIIWVGLAIVAIGVIAALFAGAQTLGAAEKQINAVAVATEEQIRLDAERAEQAGVRGEQMRELALSRMKSGWVPDPSTDFERTLLIDGIAMRMQQGGMQMPESIRSMLNYLTVEELKESAQGLV